jgi:hypothetical protein
MSTRVIKITGSDSTNGSLDLDDGGHTRAKAGDTIKWDIGQHSGVYSIVSIQEKSGSTDIWSTPPRQQGNHWEGQIDSGAADCDVYVYSITWKASEKEDPLTFDPIISIKPTTGFINTFLYMAAAVATAAVAFFAFKFLFKKLKK